LRGSLALFTHGARHATITGLLLEQLQQLDSRVVADSRQAHVPSAAAVHHTDRIGGAVGRSGAVGEAGAVLVASTEAGSISSGVALAVDIAVGAAVGEGAADLVLALGDGADAVDAGAGWADVAAEAAVVGVGQEVGSTASGGRDGGNCSPA